MRIDRFSWADSGGRNEILFVGQALVPAARWHHGLVTGAGRRSQVR